MVGKIIHLVKDKGYGFIQSSEYDGNIFFHSKSVRGGILTDLSVGDEVDFAPATTTNKGHSTDEVTLLS